MKRKSIMKKEEIIGVLTLFMFLQKNILLNQKHLKFKKSLMFKA